jgi:hypothetical protein
LYKILAKDDEHTLALKIRQAIEKALEELQIKSLSLRGYIEKSLPKITTHIIRSVRTNTLGKTFVSPLNPDLKPKIRFFSGGKMDDHDYRKLINEFDMPVCIR